MELFNSFTDTVFKKDNNNLEKQIAELEEVMKEVPDYYKDRVKYDIRMLERGLEGEKQIEFELKNANLGMYVLQDIKLEYKGETAQFDYIVITKGYTYLIECKNLIGNIYVDENGQFIREYTYDNDKYREAIYSPYTQVIRHKELLKKRWINRNSKLRVKMQEKYFDSLWYKPLVVLANHKSILNTKKAPKEVRGSTIRIDALIDYIKKDLDRYDRDCLSNQKQMEELAQAFLERDIDTYHSIADKYNDVISVKSIESKLKRFRSAQSKRMNVPAYYIFTNEELDNLIKFKPKDLNELKQILPEIKIKCHGKQIIKIINE